MASDATEFPRLADRYKYYRQWVKSGLWSGINALLVEQVRTQSGRAAQPSLGIIDDNRRTTTYKSA